MTDHREPHSTCPPTWEADPRGMPDATQARLPQIDVAALVHKLKSQIGDDVQHIYDHEALFTQAAAALTALQARAEAAEAVARAAADYLFWDTQFETRNHADHFGENGAFTIAEHAHKAKEEMRTALSALTPPADLCANAQSRADQETPADLAKGGDK